MKHAAAKGEYRLSKRLKNVHLRKRSAKSAGKRIYLSLLRSSMKNGSKKNIFIRLMSDRFRLYVWRPVFNAKVFVILLNR